MRVQFRLMTLLMLITGIAAGLFVWLRYVRPNVSGISVQRGAIVLHMTDEFAQRQWARDAEL